ncbi:hypothetical protein L218DRAFT_949516 [Marasmius fiardii PR-910]|nr:hypothetical protein L218DRAFT_949516 [Marasmius fiardii PR-910]
MACENAPKVGETMVVEGEAILTLLLLTKRIKYKGIEANYVSGILFGESEGSKGKAKHQQYQQASDAGKNSSVLTIFVPIIERFLLEKNIGVPGVKMRNPILSY